MTKRNSALTGPTGNDTHAKKSERLVFFAVNEDGTITDPDFKEPKINSDVYDLIWVDGLTTPKNIIGEIEDCGALMEHFRGLASNKHDDLIRRIELRDIGDNRALQQMKRLANVFEDEDDGWKEWIKIEGDEEMSRFKKEIVDWLAAPIEWEKDMPDNASAQGSAKRFFEHEDLATLDKLGVQIVEGESPTSTYYAAELHKEVEEANGIAQKLGLSYRFREDLDAP